MEDHRRSLNPMRFCLSSSGLLPFLFFFVVLSSGSSLSLSDELPQHRLSIGRNLLQAKQDCPVSFENLNYTVITSRCKGPKYPSKTCCTAFKDFACPYAMYLNEEKNNCATTMFSYINLYGRYPPGLFANLCRDSKRGLECSVSQSSPAGSTSAAAPPVICHHHLLLFILSNTILLFLVQFL